MKKFILAVAFVLMSGTIAFGSERANDVTKNIENYELVVSRYRIERMATNLELNLKQTDIVELLFKNMNKQLQDAYYSDGSDARVNEIVINGLNAIEPWLNKKQFKYFSEILFATFNNRGFSIDKPLVKKS